MQKTIYVPELEHDVVISRRKGTKSLRLSLRGDGIIRLSAPYRLSETEALRFLHSKLSWIQKHHTPAVYIPNGAHIGKSWRLFYEQSSSQAIKTRLMQNTIRVTVPSSMEYTNPEVQKKAISACERALDKESTRLLPQRLADLAKIHAIDYTSCSVKKLKSRWGSCDNRKNIVLNIYLTQLPWELIDYVILHELAHTKHQHHQASFWAFVEQLLPNYPVLRKQLKSKSTRVAPTSY